MTTTAVMTSIDATAERCLPIDLFAEATAALAAGNTAEYAIDTDDAGIKTAYLYLPECGRGGVSANSADSEWTDCHSLADLMSRWAADEMVA